MLISVPPLLHNALYPAPCSQVCIYVDVGACPCPVEHCMARKLWYPPLPPCQSNSQGCFRNFWKPGFAETTVWHHCPVCYHSVQRAPARQ